MKISTKPRSSPSRAEKFPPPLLRFLRINVGSKSSERLRSSPMFVKNKNAVIETQDQEPSSPKVTCIGQVRVRRSSKQSVSHSGGRRRRTPARSPCSCWWVPKKKTQLCHRFAKQLRPRSSFRSPWCKCVGFFQFGCCRARDDSSKMESKKEHKNSEPEDGGDKDVNEAQAEVASTEVFAAPSPPKNAFLLTRCRSVPYRSSSLASIFWGSPLTTTPQTEHDDNEENRALPHQKTYGEPDCRCSSLDPKRDKESEGNPVVSREFEASINGRIKELIIQASETGEGRGPARPPILTRSKSEPARTAARLIPEASFWRHPRLNFS